MRPTSVLTIYVYFLQGRLASLLANHSSRRGVCPEADPPSSDGHGQSRRPRLCPPHSCFTFTFTFTFTLRCQRHGLQTFLQHVALVHDHRLTSHAPSHLNLEFRCASALDVDLGGLLVSNCVELGSEETVRPVDTSAASPSLYRLDASACSRTAPRLFHKSR
eukprot:1189347-Prorocentrum_minimum.AAC.1